MFDILQSSNSYVSRFHTLAMNLCDFGSDKTLSLLILQIYFFFQGSHAFLQHEWAKSITGVINLEAVGMNGKPIVFQVREVFFFCQTTTPINSNSYQNEINSGAPRTPTPGSI